MRTMLRIQFNQLSIAGLKTAFGLCLAGLACGTTVSADDAKLESALSSVVRENIAAANAEDLDRSMDTFHEDAPTRENSKVFMEKLFKEYDLKYQLDSFTCLGDDGTYACARAKHSTVKLAGPTFRDNSLDAIWIFRKSGDDWKIWTQSNLEIQWLNADESPADSVTQ